MRHAFGNFNTVTGGAQQPCDVRPGLNISDDKQDTVTHEVHVLAWSTGLTPTKYVTTPLHGEDSGVTPPEYDGSKVAIHRTADAWDAAHVWSRSGQWRREEIVNVPSPRY